MVPSTPSVPREAVVFLVDDQPIIGEAVRRMLAGVEGIAFHYCADAHQALEAAATVRPTVILQDLVLPGIDGLELVRRYRADERLQDVPVIVLSMREEPAVKAESFAAGANDYLVKLPDKVEIIARIRHHSRGYVALGERNEAFAALQASQRLLAADIASAARYVQSLLPPPGAAGPVRADWRFIPSATLGGDVFGYHAIDEHHIAMYLLDVCGHGVGAALLSVSALNAIRSGALPGADVRDPGSVLGALNDAFPMERHNDMFFTAWYGVYHAPSRRLSWAGGGHPPALLLDPEAAEPQLLESEGPLIGAVEGLSFASDARPVAPGSRLLLYSDGVFEVARPGGALWGLQAFLGAAAVPSQPPEPPLDALIAAARQAGGRADFADDVSLLEVRFA